MADQINYSVLNNFTVIANPVQGDGYLRVNMNATVTDVDNSPLYYADTNLWDDHYVFHLHHSGGVDFDLLHDLTEHLKEGRRVQFKMDCFVHQLDEIGFVGVPRV